MEWCIDANVLVKAVIREPLSEKATALMSDALAMDVSLIAPHFGLRWLYDAFYVALAEDRACMLWTADEELYEAVKDELPFVKLLEDYASNT
jgi:predicted nucleic acid-binding protein